jgi:stage II sporulation protein D
MLASHIEAGMNDTLYGFVNKPYAETADSLRILVLHDKPGVLLEVKGRYQVFDPNTNTILGNRYSGKRKFLQPLQDGIRWGEEFPGVFQLLIQPDDKNTTTIVDGIEYKGRLYVYDIGGTISIVNELPFDEYVRTVISSKLQQKLPEEALAALAITARTNANYLKQNTRHKFWNVDAKQIDYQGFALANPSSVLDQVIKATHNMVMSNSSAPFLAKWDIVDATAIPAKEPVISRITIDQATMFAHQGDHAAQILKKAFPDAQVGLISE